MKSIYTPNIILPESIADEKISAAAQALDEQLKLLSAAIEETLHLPRLDKLTGDILDLLANQFHVDFFDAVNLSDQTKKNLIRQSIALHRRYGTVWSVEQIVNEFFNAAQVKEVGDFRFRIWSKGYSATPAEEPMFWQMLNHAKNVRSWLDGLEFDFSPEEPTTVRAGVVMAVAGVQNIWPARLTDQKQTLYAGNILHVDGNIEIAPAYPPLYNKVLVHAGYSMLIVGNITIANHDQPTLRQHIENPNADLLIANIGIPR